MNRVSILTSIKKLLGISEDYIAFDQDIIIHINSVFMILKQIGVGPQDDVFVIKDKSATWDQFVDEDEDLEAVKSYVYLKVKLVFDPPLNGAVMEALKQSINEYEWRLNINGDTDE